MYITYIVFIFIYLLKEVFFHLYNNLQCLLHDFMMTRIVSKNN